MGYKSIFNPNLFKGQNIIVTGGGSGIGRCTAHELSSLGAQIVIIGRNEEKLKSVQTEIESDGGICTWYTCDIREEETVKETVSNIYQNHSQIHGLVNNAGGQFISPAEGISRNGFEAVVKSNLVGGFLFAREVYNQGMRKQGGAIVNMIAEMRNGMPGMAHSGAARAGMENLTKTLAYEWGGSGVRVNSISPGYIASSGMDTYGEGIKPLIKGLKESVPLKRFGTESETSSAICFLLSEGASFINGACIHVDGGSPLGSQLWPLKPAKNNEPFDGFHLSETPDILKEGD